MSDSRFRKNTKPGWQNNRPRRMKKSAPACRDDSVSGPEENQPEHTQDQDRHARGNHQKSEHRRPRLRLPRFSRGFNNPISLSHCHGGLALLGTGPARGSGARRANA